MMRTFNNGLGLVLALSREEAGEALLRLEAMGETAFHIGSVEARDGEEEAVQFVD
jgi:phosphoribosylformylglycinamidine cyclo-ligase